MKCSVGHHRRFETSPPVEPAKEDADYRIEENRPRDQCWREANRLSKSWEVTDAKEDPGSHNCSPCDACFRSSHLLAWDSPPDEHEDRHQPESEQQFLSDSP